MRYLILVVAIFASFSVSASDAALSWSAPSHRVDGSVFDHSNISHYEVCVFLLDGCDVLHIVTGEKTSITLIDSLSPNGEYTFFKIRVFDDEGLTSEWSEPVSKKQSSPPLRIVLIIK